MVTPHLPEGTLSVPPIQGWPRPPRFSLGRVSAAAGTLPSTPQRADNLTSQGKFISQRWKSRNAENTIRFWLVRSPMLFCESVITGSNKCFLQQILEPGLRLSRLNKMACCEGIAFVSN